MTGSSNTLVESLRDYLLDKEELNELNLNELELEDPVLQGAVKDGAQAYDLTLPLSTTDLGSVSVDSKEWYYIKRLAAIEALQRLVFLHIRNQNSVNDQGFKVDEHNKANEWTVMKRALRANVEPKVEAYKRALAYQSFIGSTISMVDPDYYNI